MDKLAEVRGGGAFVAQNRHLMADQRVVEHGKAILVVRNVGHGLILSESKRIHDTAVPRGTQTRRPSGMLSASSRSFSRDQHASLITARDTRDAWR